MSKFLYKCNIELRKTTYNNLYIRYFINKFNINKNTIKIYVNKKIYL